MTGWIKEFLAPIGIEHFGVCSFSPDLVERDVRAKRLIPEGARSIIVFLFPFYTGEHAPRNVARYAVSPDYHTIVGNILNDVMQRLGDRYPSGRFAAFVDNSPFVEVRLANRAGLGTIGKHGLLIHPEYGSLVFIGEIVTTLELPVSDTVCGDCAGCMRCVSACPSKIIGCGYLEDPSRCRSQITQKKGELTTWEQSQIQGGGLVVGCDLCTEACPMNRKKRTPIKAFYRDIVPCVEADTLVDYIKERSYGYRGTAVIYRNLSIINRS